MRSQIVAVGTRHDQFLVLWETRSMPCPYKSMGVWLLNIVAVGTRQNKWLVLWEIRSMPCPGKSMGVKSKMVDVGTRHHQFLVL